MTSVAQAARTRTTERPDDPVHARLRADVSRAATVLASTWPLQDFIAVNPVGDLVTRSFADAAALAGSALGARFAPDEDAMRAAWRRGRITDADLVAALIRWRPDIGAMPPIRLRRGLVTAVDVLLADLCHAPVSPAPRRTNLTALERLDDRLARTLDTHVSSWCAAYLDTGQGAWAWPGRERGFFAAWRDSVRHDRGLPRAARSALRELPTDPAAALEDALATLRVPDEHRVDHLRAHLTRLPGWAAAIRGHATRDPHAGIDLLAYLAVRMSVEAALLTTRARGRPRSAPADGPRDGHDADLRSRAVHVLQALGHHAPPANDASLSALCAVLAVLPPSRRPLVWLDAYEGHYRDHLLSTLHATEPPARQSRPATQVVCCIDVRSEGLRRRLEAGGRCRTHGFAGFFAVALRYRALGSEVQRDQCPALVTPRIAVSETVAPHGHAESAVAGLTRVAAFRDALDAAAHTAGSAFALAETAGWAYGPAAVARTVAPRAAAGVGAWLRDAVAPRVPTTATVDGPLADRALLAEIALRLMGLTSGLARLVVLCGHAAQTTNNPYQAALDCGACGGHAGGPNARVASSLLNDPAVRHELAERGITIPHDTWFLPAEHNTTTDEVTVLDRQLVPSSHLQDVARATDELRAAGARLADERAAHLPDVGRRPRARGAARHVRRRAADWAQVFPEWGLAGNVAFVAAPRAVTIGLDLGRRVFLHDYDADADPSGVVLETILTAPLVVAHWINSQYYFATVDPVAFGAGSKTVHNVVGGGVGVLSGAAGDLRQGLPWQSLADGDLLRHEPQRLLAVVQAPPARVDDVIARNPVLQHLFGNDWVALAVRRNGAAPWLRRGRDGWRPWFTPAVPTGAVGATVADTVSEKKEPAS